MNISLSCRLVICRSHLKEGLSRIVSLSYRHRISGSSVMFTHIFNPTHHPPTFQEAQSSVSFSQGSAIFPWCKLTESSLHHTTLISLTSFTFKTHWSGKEIRILMLLFIITAHLHCRREKRRKPIWNGPLHNAAFHSKHLAHTYLTLYPYMQLINIPVIFPVVWSMSGYSDVKSIQLFLSVNILIVKWNGLTSIVSAMNSAIIISAAWYDSDFRDKNVRTSYITPSIRYSLWHIWLLLS